MGKGIDISHYQKNIDWDKVDVDFAILKCTESVNYKDETFQGKREECRKRGIVVGAYHFARGGDVIKEAQFFLESLGEIKEGEFLALDWEIHHSNPVGWCKDFLDIVYQKTGIRPLIYLNESTVNSYDWSPVVKGNYGLWIAKYGTNDGTMQSDPKMGKWAFISIWQYTSEGRANGISGRVDLDWAYMNKETLKKYGKQGVSAPVLDDQIFNQRNSRYKNVKIGKSNLTIYDYGCFLVSLSKVVNRDPLEVNKLLAEKGGLTADGLIRTPQAYEILGLKVIKTGDPVIINRDKNINNMPTISPTIKEVKMGKSQHFVIRLVENGKRSIFDPWGGVERPINTYSFISYRLFTK